MKRKRVWTKRTCILLVLLAVLIAGISVAVYAAYLKNTEKVKNTFSPAESVTPGIDEKFNEEVKEDVFFTVEEDPENLTEYPVYFRAAIVITWQKKNPYYPEQSDQEWIVSYQEPVKGVDYSLTLNEADWEKRDDGFYYYVDKDSTENPKALLSVPSGEKTSALIQKCEQLAASMQPPDEGYTLCVDVIVQTIQAVGYTDGVDGVGNSQIPAWEDAWPSGVNSPEPEEPAGP